MVLGGYRVVTEPSTANAGMSRWARAEKGGGEFFIKQFLDPKYPDENLPGSPEGRARRLQVCEAFQRRQEAIMNRLRNDVPGAGHLITPLAFFRSGPTYYKVTELVAIDKGVTLSACEPTDIAVALRSLLTSLRVVHDAGVVHSDLKPDNVLFERTAAGALTCKLIDFDESYLSSEPPEPKRLVGDWWFFSPEMLSYIKQFDSVGAEDLTTASDVFALGVLLHILLTGTAPGIESRFAYPCEAVRAGVPPRLHPAIGTGPLATILSATMERNPAVRPSMIDLLAAFTRSAVEDVADRLRSGDHNALPASETDAGPDGGSTGGTDRTPPETGIAPADMPTSPAPDGGSATDPTTPDRASRLRSNMGRQAPPPS
jgi:eukaryotic-like serine/threonine-protein kinase